MIILLFFLGHWYLSLFFQTFFLHRYTSHGMFKMNYFWEKTFFFLTFLVQGSSFLQPAAYGAMHRKHHSFSDTKKILILQFGQIIFFHLCGKLLKSIETYPPSF